MHPFFFYKDVRGKDTEKEYQNTLNIAKRVTALLAVLSGDA
jgi:hypothetical protein